MKESKFIQDNVEQWNKFEKKFDAADTNSNELTKLYLNLTEDLGYAQTFYYRRTVRVYLNSLARKVFSGVHKQGNLSLRPILDAIFISIPLEVYKARKYTLIAFATFSIAVLIGVISSALDINFVTSILGSGYVDTTAQNIAAGNPLKIYESDSQLQMFEYITVNNIGVALLTFFLGFFFTIGSHVLLFTNGVMLGTFQYYFYAKGLLLTSFLGIWIHGAFEISAIVMAGAAGITAGSGLLFPGSHSRLQALRISTLRGLKILLSLIVFIVLAGFLESFVTRNYQRLPDWSKWCIILFSFMIILGYYIIYPFYISRKYPERLSEETSPLVESKMDFQLYKVRTGLEVIKTGLYAYFQYVKKYLYVVFLSVFPLSMILMGIQMYNRYDDMFNSYEFDWYEFIKILFGFGMTNGLDYIVGLGWSLLISIMMLAAYWSIVTTDKSKLLLAFISFAKTRFISFYLIFMLAYLPLFLGNIVVNSFLLFYFPIIIGALNYATFRESFSLKDKLKKGASMYLGSIGILVLFLLIVTICAQSIALVFSESYNVENNDGLGDLLDYLCYFINMVLINYTDDYMFYSNGFRMLVYWLFILFSLPLLVYLSSFSFGSKMDLDEAITLREDFKLFGKRKRFQE